VVPSPRNQREINRNQPDSVEWLDPTRSDRIRYRVDGPGKNTVHRIVGKVAYTMQNQDLYRTTLRYELKSYLNMSDAQNFFNINKQDSFLIFVKNPNLNISCATHLVRTEKVEFLEEMNKIFGSYLWSPGLYEIFSSFLLKINFYLIYFSPTSNDLDSYFNC
jgi:hypothetical protein